MALKEKALKRLAEKLNAAGIPWALTGDYAAVLRGGEAQWHGFELQVNREQAAAADKILTRLGMRHEVEGAAVITVDYHFDGADIRLVCVDGPVKSDISVPVLGVPVPLLAAKEGDA